MIDFMEIKDSLREVISSLEKLELPADPDAYKRHILGEIIMPKKDLTNKFQLNEIVYLHDGQGRRVKGRINSIYQKYGTVIYEIDGIEDSYSAAAITTYHRAESVIEREDPHESKIQYL